MAFFHQQILVLSVYQSGFKALFQTEVLWGTIFSSVGDLDSLYSDREFWVRPDPDRNSALG